MGDAAAGDFVDQQRYAVCQIVTRAGGRGSKLRYTCEGAKNNAG
jgi:hypothetical protein